MTGEGKGWRNDGWGWKKLFNIIMQEMPIPLSHLATDIREKSPCTFQKGHGKSNLPIRKSVHCHLCSTASDIKMCKEDRLTGHMIKTVHCRLNKGCIFGCNSRKMCFKNGFYLEFNLSTGFYRSLIV